MIANKYLLEQKDTKQNVDYVKWLNKLTMNIVTLKIEYLFKIISHSNNEKINEINYKINAVSEINKKIMRESERGDRDR